VQVEGRKPQEVAKYASVFFSRYRELRDCDKVMRRIEQGETRIQRRIEIANALAKKVAGTKNPWVTLSIDYGAAGGRGKQFSEENDRFLVCMTNQIGYDRWDELREEVRASWLFRFDWWFRTRTAVELQRRVEFLSKLVEKELDEQDAAEEAEARKRRHSAGGKSTPGRPSPAKRARR
jgi:SWI/SNF-related matrix-associated actin-dependent regulator of chromatin subfamily A member 5